MPVLNHINLPVPDVGALRDFFVEHFGFTPIHEAAGGSMAVLRGEQGFILNIMRRRDGDADFPYPFHVGFLFDTTPPVVALRDRLAGAGVRCGAVEEMHRNGVDSTTFYCFPDGGPMVEVSCYR
ncbi:MAG: VOC family protein [Gemmatimonadaceae bacterium]|nr:VOC family protein [Gemmatimonadaceae bacterium]